MINGYWANPANQTPEESGIYYVVVDDEGEVREGQIIYNPSRYTTLFHLSIDEDGTICGNGEHDEEWDSVEFWWSETMPESPKR
jgi:hypothetical protein